MAMVLGADVVWSNSHCNARPALRQMRQHPICNSAKSSAGSVISSLSMAYFPHCRHRQRIMQPCRATASSGGAGQPVPQSGGAASSQRAQQLKRAGSQSGNALFGLIVINLIIFFLDHVMQQGWIRVLYLNHTAPRLWQFLTCAFCHGSWQHLSSNLFGLYVFGREVEIDGGALGVISTYLFTAAGASIASWLMLPHNSLSLGASGAVFGLYAVSVLLKLSNGFSVRKIIEAGILGQFVISSLQQEFISQSSIMGQGAMVGASGVSHVAHLAGAAAGVLLIVLLSRVGDVKE